MKFKLLRLFVNKSLLCAGGLLVIQQILAASSSFWIAGFIRSIQESQNPLLWLGLYMSSLFLPYFPGAASIVQMAKAKALISVEFVGQFREKFRGCLLRWSNSKDHSQTASILSGEAPQALGAHLDYIYHFSSCGLNVLLNLVAVAVIVDLSYLASYAIGITLAGIVLKIQAKRKRGLSLEAQSERIRWTETVLALWDNVLLNNKYNLDLWSRSADERAAQLVSKQVGLERFSQRVSVVLAFLLLGPTFVLVTYLVIQNLAHPLFLGLIAVTLPRLFQVLAYSYEFLFLLSAFPAQRARVETILTPLETAPKSEMDTDEIKHRVQWDSIVCSSSDGSRS
ncbi:MAG: hypothetical protein ACOYKZ_03160 [Chlamydiia bacterium]